MSGSRETPHPPNPTDQVRGLKAHDSMGWGEGHLRTAMDALYLVCVVVAGSALVLISAVIPWGVYTRYVLNSAASWPEPTAVLLTIWLTFFGAAACYRLRFHMNVSFFVKLMPLFWQRFFDALAEIAMVAMALFMTVYGTKLVIATW